MTAVYLQGSVEENCTGYENELCAILDKYVTLSSLFGGVASITNLTSILG